MAFHLTFFAIISAVTALIAVAVAVAAWPRRAVPGAIPLIWLMVASFEWSLGAALEYAAVGVHAKVFWSKVEYVGTLSAPVFFLLFAMQYNRLEQWMTRGRVTALFVVPLLTVGLAATNEQHGLIWSGFSPSPDGDNLMIYRHGAGFWVGVIGYSYLVMLAGTSLLVWAVIRFPKTYRRQAGALLAGALIPWGGDWFYTLGLSPLRGLELTPLLLTGAGVGFAVSLFQFQLFALVPVARGALIEMMTEGVLVLDAEGRLLDLNPASRHLLNLPAKMAPGGNIREALAAWPALVNLILTMQGGRIEIPLPGTEEGFCELNISPLQHRDGRNRGLLVVMQDITVRKRAEAELKKTHEALLAQVAEIQSLQTELREQAIRDSLTQLFNRRYLDEALERELARAAYDHACLSLVVIDIDHFKSINDTFGHKGGDEVLQSFGALLRERTRREDVACRYGGEEFVVVLPGANAASAVSRVQEWRTAFEETIFSWDGKTVHATFSAGVASYPTHGVTAEELLFAGDHALYAAKSAGRNLVLIG